MARRVGPEEGPPRTGEGGQPTPVRSGCDESLPVEYVGLSATFTADSGVENGAVQRVRFVGRRIGTRGPHDRFDRVEEVGGVDPPFTLTTRVTGINPGEWEITATPQSAAGTRRVPRQHITRHTQAAPLLRGPGVRQLAWPILVLLGVLVALTVQGILLAASTGRWSGGLAVSGVAVVVGYLAAKLWFLALHRRSPRHFATAGTCIQGFLLGGFGTLVLGAALTGIGAGLLVDATTPGVLFAMSLARPGCFLGGCCAGRPTGSRWGMWSSDRRIGVRRVPVQLIEAALALVLGVAALVLFLAGPPLPGALFAGAVATYTMGRQLLFPLRGEPRRTRFGRPVVLGAAALVVVAVVGLSLAAS